MRPLLGATGGGAMVAAVLANWWIIGAVLIFATLVVVATCWIVSDGDRPQRLATVLKALQPGPAQTTPTPAPPDDLPESQQR